MVIVGNKVVSSDVIEEAFVCDLSKCKGACCVEGDLGAPLDENELPKIDEVIDVVKPYLSEEAVKVLEVERGYVLDDEGDFSTSTINNRECAFAFYDDGGVLKCSIEQAWKDGKTDFQKPISCHLYPVRVTKLEQHEALNYERWHICSPACDLGKELKVPVYKFLKEALVRKYGEEWYQNLEMQISSEGTNQERGDQSAS